MRPYLFLLLSLATVGCSPLRFYSTPAKWEQGIAFHPSKYPAGEWKPTTMIYQDAWFKSADGTRLHGWFVPHSQPKATVLVLHGNAGNITQLTESLTRLNKRHNVSLLAFDYRGYGRSDGTPSEDGLYDDARAARAWLAEKNGIREKDVVLIGHELGGAVAAKLAGEDGARGLVLVSTFTSLKAVGQRYLPLMPAGMLMKMKFDTVGSLKSYGGPLLVAHGDKDEVIPYSQAIEILGAARGPKELVTIKGGKHATAPSEDYYDTLDRFLGQLD